MLKKLNEWMMYFCFWSMIASLMLPFLLPIAVVIGASYLFIYILIYMNTPPDNLF